MQIHIIGAGSIGLLIARQLSIHHDVTLYVRRKEQMNALLEHGIHYYVMDEYVDTTYIPIKQIDDYRPGDIVFICVTQNELPSVLQQLQAKIGNDILIFIQNGMTHIEAAKQFPHVYIGSLTHGAIRSNDFTVNHLGLGNLHIAPLQSENKKLEQLHHEDFPVKIIDNWREILTKKLLINAVINPLTALFGCKNGEIYKNQSLIAIAKKLCAETASVLELDQKEAWESVLTVAKQTAANTSSMLADIQGKRKTEVEAITGYILSQTTREVPYTQFVYDAILALEQGGKNGRTNNGMD